MVRTQIQLTEDQYARLKQAAHEKDVPLAELIRQAVDRWLTETSGQQRFEAALTLLGKYHDDETDVSQQHDRYLQGIWAGATTSAHQ